MNTLSERTGRNVINSNRLGDLAEQWVCLLAAWKGAEIFPNNYSTGPVDLLMRVDDHVILIDVKCDQLKKGRWCATHTGEVKPPVYPVAVTPEGDVADWKVRWIRNRAPEGLETFWDKNHLQNATNTVN